MTEIDTHTAAPGSLTVGLEFVFHLRMIFEKKTTVLKEIQKLVEETGRRHTTVCQPKSQMPRSCHPPPHTANRSKHTFDWLVDSGLLPAI